MYYSEYLRNKKRAAPQVISPPRGRDSSLWTQIQRYKNSGSIVTPLSAGQMLQLSGDGVIATKGHAAVCCTNTITVQTAVAGTCCDLVVPNNQPGSDTIQYPRGFYQPPKPDCCPVNGPPIADTTPCCPGLPANTSAITWNKGPRTQG